MCATPQSSLETPKKKKVPVLPIKLKSLEKKTTHTPNGKLPLSSTKFPTGDTPKLSLYERIMLKQKANEERLEPLKLDILLPRLGRDIKFTGGELTEHIELLCECAHTYFVINTVGPHSTKYLRLLTHDENDYRNIMETIEKEFKKCQ
uniref:Uncharacterized protein n=1 Tax=Panagrolaimus davidi TaxID=227884 RepID=A0A914QJ69_9BILA